MAKKKLMLVMHAGMRTSHNVTVPTSSPMTLLANARIDAARRFLEATDLSLREIAQRCGFEDTYGFRRTFHRRLQINPADYRDRFRSKKPLAEKKKPAAPRAESRVSATVSNSAMRDPR